MKNLTIRDIERMENEQERLNGKSYMESLYGIKFTSSSIQTNKDESKITSISPISDQTSVTTDKSWKREFIIGLAITIIGILASIILHQFGLL